MDRVTGAHSWQVLDSLQQGGKDVCEDRIGVSGSLAWVIDGATPLSDTRLTDSASDAAWLAERLDYHLRALSRETGENQTLTMITEQLFALVARDAANEWMGEPESPPSAALGLVRNHGTYIDYLVLADVTVHVSPHGPTVSDDRVEASTRDSMALLREELSRTHEHETAMQIVRPSLLASRVADMNRPGGYWVASTDPESAKHAICGRVPSRADTRVLMCTDGFSRAWNTFPHFSDAGEVVVSAHSAREVLERIRNEESADVECVRYPRWNVHDDAAVLILTPSTN